VEIIAITARRELIVGAEAFPGNRCDGDTLAERTAQLELLI
jgi:hypothetical protein